MNDTVSWVPIKIIYLRHPRKAVYEEWAKLEMFTTVGPILCCNCFTYTHCQFSRFSFTFIVCRQFSTLCTFAPDFFFVKLQCSALKNFHLTNSFYFFILLTFFLKILIASYGARARGSIFKMELI